MVLNSDPSYLFLFLLFLPGLLEEIFFRGFLQVHLHRFFTGDVFTIGHAAIITGVIFGVSHLFSARLEGLSLKDESKKVPFQIFIGILLGYIFQVSNTLIYPIIMHNLIDSGPSLYLYHRLDD